MTTNTLAPLYVTAQGALTFDEPTGPHISVGLDVTHQPTIVHCPDVIGMGTAQAYHLIAGCFTHSGGVKAAGMLLLRSHQFTYLHPRTWGLVRMDTFGYLNGSLGYHWLDKMVAMTSLYGLESLDASTRNALDTLLPDLEDMLDRDEHHNQGLLARRAGWFAPEANPLLPGTPFLVPVMDSDSGSPRWQVRRVGDTGVTARERPSALWDNREVMGELVELMREHAADPEVAQVARTLCGDGGQVQEEARLLDEALALAAARAAFARPKDRIKPRKVQSLVWDVVHACERELPESTRYRRSMRLDERTLRPTQLRYTSGRDGTLGALHAAMVLTLPEHYRDDYPAGYLTSVGRALAVSLAAAGLGAVMAGRTLQGNDCLVITRRRDLVREHAQALGLNGGLSDLDPAG